MKLPARTKFCRATSRYSCPAVRGNMMGSVRGSSTRVIQLSERMSTRQLSERYSRKNNDHHDCCSSAGALVRIEHPESRFPHKYRRARERRMITITFSCAQPPFTGTRSGTFRGTRSSHFLVISNRALDEYSFCARKTLVHIEEDDELQRLFLQKRPDESDARPHRTPPCPEIKTPSSRTGILAKTPEFLTTIWLQILRMLKPPPDTLFIPSLFPQTTCGQTVKPGPNKKIL